jgi:hypothetical protein
MTELQERAALAGLFFGVWPLFMNRSGLSGNVSTAIMEAIVFLIVLPIGFRSYNSTSFIEADWLMMACAAFFAAMGVLVFNGGLAITNKDTTSTFFVTMIAVQIMVPAVYKVFVTRSVTPEQLIGFTLAMSATYLLNK